MRLPVSSCLSVRPRVTTLELLIGFSWNLISGSFTRICPHIPIGQFQFILDNNMKSYVRTLQNSYALRTLLKLQNLKDSLLYGFGRDAIMNFQWVRILREAVTVFVMILSTPEGLRKTTGNLNKDSRLTCPRIELGDSLNVSYNELQDVSFKPLLLHMYPFTRKMTKSMEIFNSCTRIPLLQLMHCLKSVRP
jgi:hypothetical protein